MYASIHVYVLAYTHACSHTCIDANIYPHMTSGPCCMTSVPFVNLALVYCGGVFDNDKWEPAIWWFLSGSYREGAIIEAKQENLSCAQNGNLKNETRTWENYTGTLGGVSKPASQSYKPVSQYASYHVFVVFISFSLFSLSYIRVISMVETEFSLGWMQSIYMKPGPRNTFS